jgi:hypothetical protein
MFACQLTLHIISKKLIQWHRCCRTSILQNDNVLAVYFLPIKPDRSKWPYCLGAQELLCLQKNDESGWLKWIAERGDAVLGLRRCSARKKNVVSE